MSHLSFSLPNISFSLSLKFLSTVIHRWFIWLHIFIFSFLHILPPGFTMSLEKQCIFLWQSLTQKLLKKIDWFLVTIFYGFKSRWYWCICKSKCHINQSRITLYVLYSGLVSSWVHMIIWEYYYVLLIQVWYTVSLSHLSQNSKLILNIETVIVVLVCTVLWTLSTNSEQNCSHRHPLSFACRYVLHSRAVNKLIINSSFHK